MQLKRVSMGRYWGWIDGELEIPSALMEDPEKANQLAGAAVVLECQARRIVRLSMLRKGSPQSCFIYLFRNTSFGRSLRSCYSMHVMKMAEMLRQEGQATLEILAALRPRGQILNADSWMIAREIDSVRELPSVGRHVYQVHRWADFDSTVAGAVAERLAHFHQRGFVHGDLKTRHVLVRSNGLGNRPEIIFVDLEKTRRLPRGLGLVHDLFSARDLIQLLASLPVETAGRSLEMERKLLLDEYFRFRQLASYRERLMRRVLSWYGPGGRLRQGKTVLGALLRDSHSNSESRIPNSEFRKR